MSVKEIRECILHETQYDAYNAVYAVQYLLPTDDYLSLVEGTPAFLRLSP